MVDYAAYGVRTAGKAGIERPPELTLSLFPSAKTQRGSSWRLPVGYGIKMRMGMLARNPCSVVPGISGRKTSLVRKAPVRLGRLLGCLPSLIPASPDIGGAPPCKGRLFQFEPCHQSRPIFHADMENRGRGGDPTCVHFGYQAIHRAAKPSLLPNPRFRRQSLSSKAGLPLAKFFSCTAM